MGGYAHQPEKSKLSILIGEQTNSSQLKNPQPVAPVPGTAHACVMATLGVRHTVAA